MHKGIFWLIDGKILPIKAECNEDGIVASPDIRFSSKSGNNFNHQAEWNLLNSAITHNKPYNYYPRGRVEIRKKSITVFITPSLFTDSIMAQIISEFDLESHKTQIKVVCDGSRHYMPLCESFT